MSSSELSEEEEEKKENLEFETEKKDKTSPEKSEIDKNLSKTNSTGTLSHKKRVSTNSVEELDTLSIDTSKSGEGNFSNHSKVSHVESEIEFEEDLIEDDTKSNKTSNPNSDNEESSEELEYSDSDLPIEERFSNEQKNIMKQEKN